MTANTDQKQVAIVTGASGAARQETRRVVLHRARRNEIFPLERAAEAYEHMMSSKARFRAVLTTGR